MNCNCERGLIECICILSEVNSPDQDMSVEDFDKWTSELENCEQPESCTLDKEDCDNCGS